MPTFQKLLSLAALCATMNYAVAAPSQAAAARVSIDCDQTMQELTVRFGPQDSSSSSLQQWDVLAKLSEKELAHPAAVTPRTVTCELSHGAYEVEFGPAVRNQPNTFCRSKLTAWVRVFWRGREALPRTVLDEDCNVDDEGSAEFRFQPTLSVPRVEHHAPRVWHHSSHKEVL